MILFLGCSLTWGQGLQIEKWISEGKSFQFCNNNAVPGYFAEHMNYEDDEFRKSKSYPNLVAKELNVSYSTKWGNGGSNDEILFIIENLDKLICPDGIELIVIQFTDMCRDDMFQYSYKNNFYDLLEIHVKNQISKIDYALSNVWNRNIPWVSLCWHEEQSKFLKEKYPKNFIKLNYNNKEFDDIHSLNQYGKNNGSMFELSDKYDGINDGHPTIKWHSIISSSIIKKIKDENISFTTYDMND